MPDLTGLGLPFSDVDEYLSVGYGLKMDGVLDLLALTDVDGPHSTDGVALQPLSVYRDPVVYLTKSINANERSYTVSYMSNMQLVLKVMH